MRYCYMDETGNQWEYGKQGNSKYFFIVFLLTKNPNISEQILKKTFKRMLKKWIKHKGGVFHATNELHESRVKILEYAQGKDIRIVACYLNKTNMYGISKDPHLLYNNMTIKLLKSCIEKSLILKWEKIQLFAARKETNKFLNQQFINQIHYAMDSLLDIEVFLRYPQQEKGLQLVDSFALALFHKYEFCNTELYNLIKEVFLLEEEYWKFYPFWH